MDIEEYIGHPLPRRDIDPELLTPVDIAPKRSWKDKGRDGKKGGGRRSDRDRQSSKRPAAANRSKSDNKSPQGNEPVRVNKQAGPSSQTPVPTVGDPATVAESANPAQSMDHVASSIDQEQVAHLGKASNQTTDAPKGSDQVPAQPAKAGHSKSIVPAVKAEGKITRFSRKFGEIPLIG
jgi:hypothetical protein